MGTSQIEESVVKTGAVLTLPDLIATRKLSVGSIHQLIRRASTQAITEVEKIQLSKRTFELVCILDSGERYVVTKRKKIELPEGLDGVIRIDSEGTCHWLKHKSINAFESSSTDDWGEYKKTISAKWNGAIRFRSEQRDAMGFIDQPGLRPPQLGAIHSIAGHWSVESNAATVVMPTGTGKTEVMLTASLLFADAKTFLVTVPSRALRGQTFKKFLSLGLLRELGIVPIEIPNPIVGVIERRPKTVEDLCIFEQCHVVISVMDSLNQGTAVQFQTEISKRVSTLVVDEAHHVPARTWNAFVEKFENQRVLQLTATPYRRDGKLVGGSVVFNYGIGAAQRDGYFKPIEFKPIYQHDDIQADREIATLAVSQLKEDLTEGFEHLVLARCSSIQRAEEVVKIYAEIAPEYSPVLVHSEMGKEGGKNLEQLKSLNSRIVVCVSMLGEGFDLPNLKIAAVHDTHKSLAILLQFTGRFVRSSGDTLGGATVVANTANQDVSIALERLYQEDADWNSLLREYSSEAAKEHRELIEFLEQSEKISGDKNAHIDVAANLLTPKCSATVFKCRKFRPKKFINAIFNSTAIVASWLHQSSNTLYFVTRREISVGWSRSKEIRDVAWDLFVVHFDKDRKLLFISASDNSSLHEALANAVGCDTALIMRGEIAFRTLGKITRLRFQQIGVKKAGRRNLSYAMYTGSEVQSALTLSQKAGSYKSNLAGTGFSNGEPITVGCSYKGRVWSKDKGPIRKFLDWCDMVGEKLVDDSIDPSSIIENVLVPEEIQSLPEDISVLSTEWPNEIIRQSSDRVLLERNGSQTDLSFVDIDHLATREEQNTIEFTVRGVDWTNVYSMSVGGDAGYDVQLLKGEVLKIKAGRLGPMPLAEYLQSYPPLFLMSDLSEINGNLWIRPNEKTAYELSQDRFEVWDWTGVNIKQESMWKNGKLRKKSIQHHVAGELGAAGNDIVFDDDSAGEAADLVCIKELEDTIELTLVHCKFSGNATAGERVKDVVEVCSQAIRSAKWKWKFKSLCAHIKRREAKLKSNGRKSRFVTGGLQDVGRFLKLSRSKELVTRIVVVQPGLKENCSDDQKYVLAATDSYLLETVGIKLEIVCSG
jgi:superfamily II DNA or RNA helicase